MPLDFPSSPTTGQRLIGPYGEVYTFDGVRWSLTPGGGGTGQSVPHCGQLRYVSATQLAFVPFNGNLIRINGFIHFIPPGGIISDLANTGLAGSALYRVYCFEEDGALRAEFSTVGHETSQTPANAGTEIKIGDDSRTLLGVVSTGAATPGTFHDERRFRYTRSWFNRRRTSLFHGAAVSIGTGTVSSLSTGFVCFAGEPLFATTHWFGTCDAQTNLFMSLRLNEEDQANNAVSTPHTTAAYENMSVSVALDVPTESLHWIYQRTNGLNGTASGTGALAGMLG